MKKGLQATLRPDGLSYDVTLSGVLVARIVMVVSSNNRPTGKWIAGLLNPADGSCDFNWHNTKPTVRDLFPAIHKAIEKREMRS